MRRRVEIVGAGGRVERVADRDLVRDDEDRALGPRDELRERATVPPRDVVEALAAGKRIAASVRALPRAVVVDRHAFELADVDVVEERLLDERDLATRERELGRLARAPEARV
jgi:hypothetical protein